MAVPLETVVKQLEDSGIVAAGKLENFVPPKAHPKSTEELVAGLVKQNHLTKFQAQHVAGGKTKSLILGGYTIIDKIGAGGMGQVFKALHRRMDRTVAIKMLPPAMTKDAAAAARFEREVRAAAKLLHPNIVSAFDADQANGVHFLVMEYVEGKDLSALVKKDGPFPIAKAVNYVLQAAKGLEFAHSEGVVHRDIKPANLLLDKKGVVKILDMGLARIDAGDGPAQAELTGTGTIMGTVDYMAPEQGLSTKRADARADIYSLGCSLHYLLIGKAAYDGETVAAKLLAHHTHSIPSLRDVNADVPEQVEAVFKKMVAKKIEDRYQTMTEVVAELEKCQAALTSAATSSTSVWQSSVAPEESDLSIAFAAGRIPSIRSSDAEPLPTARTKKPRTAGKQGPSGKNTKLLIGAGAGGLLVVLLGVIVIFRNQKGEEVGRMELPDGTSVEVQATAKVAPSKVAGQPNQPWNTPAFLQWMKNVANLRGEELFGSVARKLQELNPGFDGRVTGADGIGTPKVENGVITELGFLSDNVTDISPVRALLGLKVLTCGGGSGRGKLSDLSPLQGMPLTTLYCNNTSVFDLSPLKGMKLESLRCQQTHAVDFSPLQDCKSLKSLRLTKASTSTAAFAALQKALPNCKIEWDGETKPWNTPAFQQWVKATQALPAEKQIEAVSKKLMELNPGFDGRVTGIGGNGPPKIENGVVTDLGFITDNVTDIAPVRALLGLKKLDCTCTAEGKGKLSDLSPLNGMQLRHLYCQKTLVFDLSPLQGMPLVFLMCSGTSVSDLSPLSGMSLTRITLTPNRITKGLIVIRQMKTLTALGTTSTENFPPAEFWKKYDAGEFGKPFAPPKLAYLDPAFQQWVKDTQALPAEKQVEAVSKKLVELNPGFDGTVTGYGHKGTPTIVNGVVREFGFDTEYLNDISPVRALTELRVFRCTGGSKGGKLSDLSPLQGMKLSLLYCNNTSVSDLSPLAGMPLTSLFCTRTQVSDLSPLNRMPLLKLTCDETQVSDLSPLQSCKSLKELVATKTKVTPASVAALQKALPNCWIEWDDPAKSATTQPSQPWNTPAFQQWVKATQALPAEQQIEAVSKKLMELNPGFDGKVFGPDRKGTPTVENGTVTAIGFYIDKVTDISPVRALTELKHLNCSGLASAYVRSPLSDLSPLQGMKLTYLTCHLCQVSDLSPLKGMPLTTLNFPDTPVSDLSMLEGMPLSSLNCDITKVSDFSPLRNAPLTKLACEQTSVVDLSPLAAMNLTELVFTPRKITKGLDVVRQMKSIKTIGISYDKRLPPDEFWKKYDAGEFGKPAAKLAYLDPAIQAWVKETQALPAEKQIEAVSKKLMELNPGFDGKPRGKDWNNREPKIENGVVTEIGFITDNITDLSPIRALLGLKDLAVNGSASGKGKLSDLSPIKGMNLTMLNCGWSPLISNLGPLAGMQLVNLNCDDTLISELLSLNGMPLTYLRINGTKVTPAQVAALQKALPDCKIEWDDPAKPKTPSPAAPAKLFMHDPAFQVWVKVTQALPAEQQIEAVSKKLMELNPGFDGTLSDRFGRGTPKIEDGVVTEYGFNTAKVTDISPVRALSGLKSLRCSGVNQGGSGIRNSDLSPLSGMQLTFLDCAYNRQLSDLSPLKDVPLRNLLCFTTQVSDLSPLQNCKSLKELRVTQTKVTPASVAALQKALPNCKIDWDDPAMPKTSEPASSGTK